MFVIYRHPRDYPDKYVVRRWWIGRTPGKPQPDTDRFFVADTLEGVRAHIPPNFFRIERDPNDEPQIVECWI